MTDAGKMAPELRRIFDAGCGNARNGRGETGYGRTDPATGSVKHTVDAARARGGNAGKQSGKEGEGENGAGSQVIRGRETARSS
jgi:hypothetical protein